LATPPWPTPSSTGWVHNAHLLKLTGDSVRRPEGNLTQAKKGAK
jgi:hypothetical protein